MEQERENRKPCCTEETLIRVSVTVSECAKLNVSLFFYLGGASYSYGSQIKRVSNGHTIQAMMRMLSPENNVTQFLKSLCDVLVSFSAEGGIRTHERLRDRLLKQPHRFFGGSAPLA